MFSARFEDALEHATDEELFSFFSEVPSEFRRRLITVLSELEAHEVQHYLNTVLPEEPPTPPPRRVGASLASLSALQPMLCLAVRRTLLRPVRGQLRSTPLCSSNQLRRQVPILPQPSLLRLWLRIRSLRLPLRLRGALGFPSLCFRACQHAAPRCCKGICIYSLIIFAGLLPILFQLPVAISCLRLPLLCL